MNIIFNKCTLLDLEDFISEYQNTLSSPIDSFLEDHIAESEHFFIIKDDIKIGYFSVNNKELLTQFYISKAYRYLGQAIFFKVKRIQNVHSAFVSTGDEFFLSHAMDECKRVDRQAYFFKDSEVVIDEEKRDNDLTVQLAKKTDIDDILKRSSDFFDDIDKSIANEIIYIIRKDNNIVGFGVIEKSSIMKDYASIGMYTVEQYRQKGIGRNILLILKEIVYMKNMKPIAGCWYYNHNSKKTLESAGMYSDTRLLNIHF